VIIWTDEGGIKTEVFGERDQVCENLDNLSEAGKECTIKKSVEYFLIT